MITMATRLSSLAIILLVALLAAGCGSAAEDEMSDAEWAETYESDRAQEMEERGAVEPYKLINTEYSEHRIYSVVLHGKQCYILESDDEKFICDWSSEGVSDTSNNE